jgi:hypothetical protein
LHVAENGGQSTSISEQTIINALDIAELLIKHAIIVFNTAGINQATSDAKEIWQWLKIRGQLQFTQTEIVRAMKNKKLHNPDRLQQALIILQKHHLISEPAKKPTRKPTTYYHVNPTALCDRKS